MTNLPARPGPPDRLTDEQRALIREFFDERPDGGYKAACKHAGLLRLTKTEARQLIEADPDLAEHREKRLGIDEDSAWRRVAKIAADPDHKDALRANTFILAAVHGRREGGTIEVTGAGGAPIDVRQQGVSLIAVGHVLREAGVLDELLPASEPRGAVSAARPVLAEPGDV